MILYDTIFMKTKQFIFYLILIILIITFYNKDLNFSSTLYKINKLTNKDGVFKNFKRDIIYNNAQLHYFKGISTNTEYFTGTVPKLKLASYKVNKNDNLKKISIKMGLNIDTLISINDLASEYSLIPGKTILIPNMKGIVHQVENNTTIYKIAKKYKISPLLIVSSNKLKRKELYKGDEIFIPNGKLTREYWKFYNKSIFIMPLYGRLTSKMGWRKDPFTKKRTYHGGIDIAAKKGTNVRASQKGKVGYVGFKGGYGKLIILEHKFGYKTYYGHLSKILVRKGQYIKTGQTIGKVGSTGRSTGPHLHFEIRKFNSLKDPLALTKNLYHR